MDMAFDLDETAPDRRSEALATRVVHPSWPELLLRMIAAREACAAIARGNRAETVSMCGSFDEVAATQIAAGAARRRSVNPNALGNRKSAGAIASAVAGLTRTGGPG